MPKVWCVSRSHGSRNIFKAPPREWIDSGIKHGFSGKMNLYLSHIYRSITRYTFILKINVIFRYPPSTKGPTIFGAVLFWCKSPSTAHLIVAFKAVLKSWAVGRCWNIFKERWIWSEKSEKKRGRKNSP